MHLPEVGLICIMLKYYPSCPSQKNYELVQGYYDRLVYNRSIVLFNHAEEYISSVLRFSPTITITTSLTVGVMLHPACCSTGILSASSLFLFDNYLSVSCQ